MYKKTAIAFFLFLLLFSAGTTWAQQKFTVSGTIKDQKTGETMIGVTVFPLEIPGVGTTCNEYGFYSLTLPQGRYRVVYSYIGYESDTLSVTLNENVKSDRTMSENAMLVKEVVITADKKDDNITKTEIGVEKIDVKEIAKLPVIFGEKDVLKTIQLLPGIKSAGEGSSGFFVRGGSADQNLILLDEAPIYNASHLLGFFSTFNSDALKDVTIIKGNSPAQYGGRLSSVLDVKMKEGNNRKYAVTGGLGLISSRLSVEGPIVKDKGSFIVSGRRTYADVFLKLTEEFKDNTLYFYDFNAKANYKINDKNRVFLSGYFGRDVLGIGSFAIVPLFYDPVEFGNNYRFLFTANGQADKAYQVTNDNIGNGDLNAQPFFSDDLKFYKGDTVQVTMLCIDINTYNFYYTLSQIAETGPGGGATPTNPPTNITGNTALGIFSAHTTQTKTMIIE